MQLKKDDLFIRSLRLKQQTAWSTEEVLKMFKHYYGASYETALVNTVMDALDTYAPKLRAGEKDKLFAKAMSRQLGI